jgi:hypothetical protein
MFWIAFSLGLFVGVALGLFTAGLCAMAARRDHQIDSLCQETAYPASDKECVEQCFSAPM